MNARDERCGRKFPKDFDEWANASALITSNASGRSLEIMAFQVMQDWEHPLMEKMGGCVAEPGSSVLEIGFGLGLSSKAIQAKNPALHVIVEGNRDVARNARELLAPAISKHNNVHIIEGFWENVVKTAELQNLAPNGFQGILFDTFPLCEAQLHQNHFPFFPIASQLLAKGGVFTYFSDENDRLSPQHELKLRAAFPGSKIETESVIVKPWNDCEYWKSSSILHVLIRL